MSNYHNIDLHKIALTAIEQYGFYFVTAKPVIDEINALDSRKLLDAAQDEAKDLRGLLWSSIDDTESLDLDQLEYCERGTSGEIIVKVAIADVDLFVPLYDPIIIISPAPMPRISRSTMWNPVVKRLRWMSVTYLTYFAERASKSDISSIAGLNGFLVVCIVWCIIPPVIKKRTTLLNKLWFPICNAACVNLDGCE